MNYTKYNNKKKSNKSNKNKNSKSNNPHIILIKKKLKINKINLFI